MRSRRASLITTTCADGELGFEYCNELSDLPLQVDTALDPRDTAVETVEPNPHRGDVSFDGSQSHDHFVELALDAVGVSVNAAQVNQPDIFSFVVLWGILGISHDRIRPSMVEAMVHTRQGRVGYRPPAVPYDCHGQAWKADPTSRLILAGASSQEVAPTATAKYRSGNHCQPNRRRIGDIIAHSAAAPRVKFGTSYFANNESNERVWDRTASKVF